MPFFKKRHHKSLFFQSVNSIVMLKCHSNLKIRVFEQSRVKRKIGLNPHRPVDEAAQFNMIVCGMKLLFSKL